jgi:cytochrome c-type biogenesis protein CcmH/NrfF
MRLAAALLLALAIAAPAAAACDRPRVSLAKLEGEVMCPVCKTTLDQSSSPAAERIRVLIRQRIARCESESQIKDALVADFGERILAAPPRKGFDLLAWWLPIGGILAAALAVAAASWHWSRTREPGPPGVDPQRNGKSPLDPELERRVDEALAELDA